MKQQIILFFFIPIYINVLFTSCNKHDVNTISNQNNEFHINQIDSELKVLTRAFNDILKIDINIRILKDAIYDKKKDENISIKDFYTYNDTHISKYNDARIGATTNFENHLYSAVSKYSNISFTEFQNLIDKFDMAIYWEYLELWDGISKPVIGYPLNEEEDVNNDYYELSYAIYKYTGGDILNEIIVQREYLKDNPVILIRPMEDFENNSPNYYSDETYVWLYEIRNKKSKINSVNNANRLEDISDRFRLEEINTNGNVFDGNGGPEFRFFRNGFPDYKTGKYGFSEIIHLNLTASSSSSHNWISVGTYTNNIYQDLWTFITWQQLLGTYEQDGGIIYNQDVTGVAIEGKLDIFNIPIAGLSIGVSSTITRKDDLIDKYEMNWTSFVHNVKEKNNWGWGFNNGLPIRRTDHNDLILTYNNY